MSDSLEGVYDPLTPEQFDKVAELRRRVDGVTMPPGYVAMLNSRPTLFLTKWLVARKWIIDDAFTMFENACKWRIEQQFDTKPLFPTVARYRGFDEEELRLLHGTEKRPTDQFVDRAAAQLSSVYAAAWHKWDKKGRPVFIERTGKTKVRELMQRCRELMPPGEALDPVVVETHKQSNEVGATLLKAQNKKLESEGKYVCQVTVVLDCSGLTMGSLYGPAMELMKVNSQMDQQYSPEGMYRCYVVNAPTFIKVAWAMVRVWLDPRSQAKVAFFSAGDPTRNALLEVIDEEQLPEFLGGKCSCDGGCVPELAEHTGDALGGDVTTEVVVKARSVATHPLAVEAGQSVKWQWSSANGNDVGFSVHFKSVSSVADDAKSAELGSTLVPGTKVTSHEGGLESPSDGMLVLRFDNTHSWVKGKTIHLRVSA